ncbi:MAG: hypothetical protein MUO40_01515 [Anaerolineaceae bacterium]|nr:hypothetical protein [Anaerolineaceae bacterium]
MGLQSKKLFKHIYIIIIILLLSLSCRLSTVEELTRGEFDPHNLDSVDFTTDVLVHYDNSCSGIEYVPPEVGIQSFEVVGENLFVTRGEEKFDYQMESYTNLYCRKLAKGGEECIDFISENEYLLAVRTCTRENIDCGLMDFCYEESHTIEPAIKQIENCIIPVSSYEISYSEPSSQGSNETKKVCQGMFYLENKSPTDILMSYYFISHTNVTHREGWNDGFQIVESGKTFSQKYEAQNWTDNSYTLDTFTKLVVISNNSNCMKLFSNKNLLSNEYLYLWEDYAIELNDPCD